MQGFVNMADDLGTAIAVLVPLLCYLMGGGFLIASMWGFWQLTHSNGAGGRPWWPFATLFISATLLSFDRMLNFANASFGGGVTTNLSQQLTSYQPPAVNGGIVGATPEDTLLNILATFDYFFEAYGALVVLFGVLALHQVMKGDRNHSMGPSIVRIVFGLAVMNVQSIAATVMGYFA